MMPDRRHDDKVGRSTVSEANGNSDCVEVGFGPELPKKAPLGGADGRGASFGDRDECWWRRCGDADGYRATRVPQMTKPSSAASTNPGSQVMPVEQYVLGLARKRMAAGVLFRDKAGRVLLVEPSYKPNWEIPGGAVEADESPWATATRELAEELGWNRPLGRLLVVDYVRPQDSRPEGVVFVFDGGVLDDVQLVGMVFPDAEIVSAGFHSLGEARCKVKPLLADRLAAAVEAVEHGVTMLCEQGRRIV